MAYLTHEDFIIEIILILFNRTGAFIMEVVRATMRQIQLVYLVAVVVEKVLDMTLSCLVSFV